jgi:hypothetical protein
MIYEVHTVLQITITAFWNEMPSSPVERGTNEKMFQMNFYL